MRYRSGISIGRRASEGDREEYLGRRLSSGRDPSVRAFSLIELLVVLAVIAVLAVMVLPSIVKRVNQASGTKETADLNTFGDSLTQYILRNKIIPTYTNWGTALSGELSLPVSAITNTPRGLARAFLVDPSLSIGGATLPYTQTTNGTAKPVSARVMIVSSLDRALPVSSGTLSSTEFNAIWNTPDNAKPTTATWTAWAGLGDDLRIKKLNLEPLFYQLILIDHDTAGSARFTLNSTNILVVATNGFGWNSFYLDGSVVGLCNSNGVAMTRYLLKRNISFVFENAAWSGELTGGMNGSTNSAAFAAEAIEFFGSSWNTGAQHGANQLGVLAAMNTFMFDYTLWATECPHFSRRGATLSQVPEYEMLQDIGKNNGRLDEFSGQQGLLH